MPKQTVQFVRGLVEDESVHNQQLYFHLVACLNTTIWVEGWTPIPFWLIRSKLPNADPQILRDRGRIEISDYSFVAHISREYRIPPDDRQRILRAMEESLKGDTMVLADLFTGKQTTAKLKTLLKDESNNPIGKSGSPLRNALPHYKRTWTLYQKARVERHLEHLHEQVHTLEDQWTSSGEPKHTQHFQLFLDRYNDALPPIKGYIESFAISPYTATYGDYLTAKHRYENDSWCYQAVQGQAPERAYDYGTGVYRFRPAYKPQSTGRVGCKRGMLQSCTREMKHAAFFGIDNVRNYDRKSSQPSILLQKLQEAAADGVEGIDTSWLKEYIANPKAKHQYAGKTGLPVDTWKAVFLAVVMGGTLPKNPGRSSGKIVLHIREAAGDEQMETVFERVRDELLPFYNTVRSWHDYLIGGYLEANAYGTRAGTTISNESGATMQPLSIKRVDERRRKLAAFVLQGAEAAHIHMLTNLSRKYGYTVLQNEHDGLIVLGEIPQEAMKEAADVVGLDSWELVEKPYCDSPTVSSEPCTIHTLHSSRMAA